MAVCGVGGNGVEAFDCFSTLVLRNEGAATNFTEEASYVSALEAAR